MALRRKPEYLEQEATRVQPYSPDEMNLELLQQQYRGYEPRRQPQYAQEEFAARQAFNTRFAENQRLISQQFQSDAQGAAIQPQSGQPFNMGGISLSPAQAQVVGAAPVVNSVVPPPQPTPQIAAQPAPPPLDPSQPITNDFIKALESGSISAPIGYGSISTPIGPTPDVAIQQAVQQRNLAGEAAIKAGQTGNPIGQDIQMAQQLAQQQLLQAQKQLFGQDYRPDAFAGTNVGRGRENRMRLNASNMGLQRWTMGPDGKPVYNGTSPTNEANATSSMALAQLGEYAKSLGLNPAEVFRNERGQQTERAVAGIGQLGQVAQAESGVGVQQIASSAGTQQEELRSKLEAAKLRHGDKWFEGKLEFNREQLKAGNISAEALRKDNKDMFMAKINSDEGIAQLQFQTAQLQVAKAQLDQRNQGVVTGRAMRQLEDMKKKMAGSVKDKNSAMSMLTAALDRVETQRPGLYSDVRTMLINGGAADPVMFDILLSTSAGSAKIQSILEMGSDEIMNLPPSIAL